MTEKNVFMPVSECIEIIVSGRVQGVCFRAFSQKQAKKLNITGYAKNLPNGDVEIVACGEKDSLEQFIACCHKGPLMARVKQVKIQPWHSQNSFTTFSVF